MNLEKGAVGSGSWPYIVVLSVVSCCVVLLCGWCGMRWQSAAAAHVGRVSGGRGGGGGRGGRRGRGGCASHQSAVGATQRGGHLLPHHQNHARQGSELLPLKAREGRQ